MPVRNVHHNIFDSTKFSSRFPNFPVTNSRDGLAIIRREAL